jgi:hypothetical protein
MTVISNAPVCRTELGLPVVHLRLCGKHGALDGSGVRGFLQPQASGAVARHAASRRCERDGETDEHGNCQCEAPR